MSRHLLRVQSDGYGVHVDLRIEHADTATAQELERALRIAADEARARHAQAASA